MMKSTTKSSFFTLFTKLRYPIFADELSSEANKVVVNTTTTTIEVVNCRMISYVKVVVEGNQCLVNDIGSYLMSMNAVIQEIRFASDVKVSYYVN